MVLDGESSQEYPANAGVSQSCSLGPTLFLLYINDLPDDFICDIAIYADVLLSIHNLNWLLNLNLIYETLWTAVRSGFLISVLGKLNWFCLNGLITIVLLM